MMVYSHEFIVYDIVSSYRRESIELEFFASKAINKTSSLTSVLHRIALLSDAYITTAIRQVTDDRPTLARAFTVLRLWKAE